MWRVYLCACRSDISILFPLPWNVVLVFDRQCKTQIPDTQYNIKSTIGYTQILLNLPWPAYTTRELPLVPTKMGFSSWWSLGAVTRTARSSVGPSRSKGWWASDFWPRPRWATRVPPRGITSARGRSRTSSTTRWRDREGGRCSTTPSCE